jgi:hypothetical protein
MGWNDELQKYLLDGMAHILLRLLKETDLGGFYYVHYDLRKLLKDEGTGSGVEKERTLHHFSDENLVSFCRASAERVAKWRKEGRISNDVAYVFSLSGDNTGDLINLALETAADRNNMRRDLAPVIDILADAGLLEVASRLRRRLRQL